jgi:hypothetical protein
MILRHGWLQKHPTPTADTGEFHWYPAGALEPSATHRRSSPSLGASSSSGDGGELRLALVDRLRGVAPPAALWQLAPGRVVWAQVFAATAPGDGRRYCGLAVTVAEADGASAAELLASMSVPAAAPWDGEPHEREVELVPAPPTPLSSTQRAHRDAVLAAPAAVVRALVSGGVASVDDPARPDLPAWIASLEAWLPPAVVARPRQGEWRGGGVRVGAVHDPLAQLLVPAWSPADGVDAARPRRAWTALNELALAQNRGLDDVAPEIGEPIETALERAFTPDELARLPIAGGRGIAPWVHAIHHWGRGRLDASPAAATLPVRIADLVIARAIADLAGSGPEAAAIDRVRWHAMLPSPRKRALIAAIAARAPSLAELVVREPRDPRRRSSGLPRHPEVHRA